MHWWIATVVCICAALLIQYFCSSKLLRMKQQISIKNMAFRDAREEGSRLEEQETELKNQQKSLTHSIGRLRTDIKRLRNQIQDKGLPVPEPNFSPAELEGDENEGEV
jgi:septal ring factor EnvC (AmiA/AmiB activator)